MTLQDFNEMLANASAAESSFVLQIMSPPSSPGIQKIGKLYLRKYKVR